MNAPQRPRLGPQERQEATPRWIEVLAPSWSVQRPSRPSPDIGWEPQWIKRMREGIQVGKDLTNG